MKKNMKILMLSASMFVMTLVPSTLKADDFSGQESYYIDFCSRPLQTQEVPVHVRHLRRGIVNRPLIIRRLPGEIGEKIAALEGDISALLVFRLRLMKHRLKI